jgi:hypothetical protein
MIKCQTLFASVGIMAGVASRFCRSAADSRDPRQRKVDSPMAPQPMPVRELMAKVKASREKTDAQAQLAWIRSQMYSYGVGRLKLASHSASDLADLAVQVVSRKRA